MRSRIRLPIVFALALLGSGCSDDGPTGPDSSDLEILVVRGDRQYGEPEGVLPVPLEVRIQGRADGRGREEVEVRWAVLEGLGAHLDQESTLTDEEGLASVRLTLGPDLGRYRVQASVKGLPSGPVVFQAEAILAPELTMVPDHPVRAGDTISVEGRNLSPDPDANVVTFSGIRGRVVSASSDRLRVEVPPCLPTRSVVLRLQIGAVGTSGLPLEVLETDGFLSILPGEDRMLEASEGFSCVRLPSQPNTRFLLVAHSTGTVGGAFYEVEVTGLTEESQPLALAPERFPPDRMTPFSPLARGQQPVGMDLQWRWDEKLRTIEAELVKKGGALVSGGEEGPFPTAVTLEASPAVGDRREFNVLTPENDFEKVWARVEYLSEKAVLFFDEETPAGGFTPEDLAELASKFETPIYPTITGTFGSESDLDGNGRIIILFTPAVNRLTPDASDSYIGGYFFGLDLLKDRTGSNQGEIFYAVVPDPAGIHGPALDRATLLLSLPAILAHEFEHMVHFNQRVLVGGAEVQDALWLSEALAQMAEDLVGAAYEALGDDAQARAFRAGNWSRARRFLVEPRGVSVLATLPPGTLAERGAGWLLMKYLHGHDDQGTLLRRLVASNRTGVLNVTETTGIAWADLVTDWVGALFLDDLPVLVRPALTYPNVNLREALAMPDGRYPLLPRPAGPDSFTLSSSLWSSAPDYYIITPPAAGGGIAVNVSGPEGGPTGSASGLRVLLVRLDE